MKLTVLTRVFLTAIWCAVVATPVLAETIVLNADDGNGRILKIVSPDELNLDPDSAVVAVDVFGDEDREVNGVLFQTDKTDDNQVGKVERDGVTVDLTSTHFIDGWAPAPAFTGGKGASADNLAAMMEDIRWSAAPSPVTMDFSGLDGGGLYELQILVNEGADRDRHWDISVNDELVVDDFTSEGTNEGENVYDSDNSFVYVGEFEATSDGQINVVMQQHIGGQDQMGSDNNPILQALVLHTLNTSDDDPNVLTGSAANYGQVASTPATVREIRIRNTGPTNELVISGVEITGPDADHFTVLGDFPLAVPPDTKVDGDPEPKGFFNLSFDAKGETGAFAAEMVISSNDQTEATQSVALTASVINLLGPASHLPLDEAAGATEVADISGNGNNGNLVVPGGSVELGQDPGLASGTGLKVSGGGELTIDGGSFDTLENFSVSMWLQMDAFPASGTVFAKGNVDTPAFALLAIGGSLGWLPEASGEAPEFVAENVLTEGQAHHVVVVYDNTDGARKASIYVDGVATTQDDPLAVQDDRGLPFQFGSYNGALLLDGIYDDIQIYTRAITAEEVGQLKDNPGSSLPVGDNAPIDSDGDGLVDTREAELGTDPLVTDTDGDTLSDFDEVEVHMTNPLVLDTDEDGFEDGVELAAGNDPTDPSDGDNDRDGLTNGQEAELGTDPLNRDTDGDRFSDSFEVANGFDPLDPNSPDNSQGGPIPTRVLTGKLAEDTLGDLVVTGSFTHAVNVAETEEDVQVGDILFLRDTPAPENIEIAAQNHIEDWNAPNDFGAGPVAEGLAKVASGIRWSGQPEGVVVTLKDVDRGAYRLQMIFGEKCCDRGFFVKVNGEDIVETFSPNAFQEGDHSGAAAAYLIYEFNQTEAGDLVIDLNGTDAGFADGNAILSGVSLQFVQSLDPGEIVPVHYENDFNAYANDETDLRDGSIITSNQGTAKIVDMALQLTEDGVGGESASFKLPVLPELAEGFVFEADLLLASDGQPADGFSFNYGEIDDNASAGEEGFQNGLAVEFDTWNNGGEGADTGIGIDVSLDGNDVEIMRLEAGEDVKDSRFFNFDGEFHPISITWEPGVGVTVVIDGETIYDKLTLEGFEATSEMRIAFGARTGGSTETVQFDNMKVSGLDSRSSTSTLAEGLVAYYPLDGSLDDTAGNSHGVGKTWQPGGKQDQPELLADHPEVALTFTEGAFGQGVDLVGSEAQYIETPLANEDIFDFGAPDNPTGFTVSAWFRVDSFTKGWQALVAKGEQNQWRIHRQGGDTDRVVGNGGDGDIAREGPDVNDGEIHHIVLISEPEVSHRIFLDGVLIEAGNAPNLEDNPMPMMIGQNPDTDDRTWDGLIDDVAFWNRALTDDEVDTLANSGASLQQILTLRKGPNLPDGYVAGGPDLAGAEGLSGYYWNLGIKEIPTSGEPMHREGDGPEGADTSNSGWADNNVFNSRAITGSFDAKTFQYEGNDLTPIGEWLGDDAASYDGSDGNLDDGLFRMVGYVYAAEAGEKTITFDNGSDDGLVVYIADEAVVENDNGHGEGDPVSGTYNFPAEGYYPIDIRYFNGDWTNDAGDHGGANLRNNNLAEDLTLVQGVAGVDPFYTPMMPAGTGYANDFTYDDGTTDLGDGSIIASNDGTNSVQGGALQMTLAGTNSTASSFILPPMDLSAGWTATFDFVIEHTGENTPADGFSFNYGAIPEGENFGDPAEEGYGAATPHVSYQVDTWLWNDAAGQDAGVGIEVTGTEIALTKATDDDANFQPNERVEASATMSWHPETGASFHTTGLRTNADFTDIPTGDFTAEAGYGFSFLARTGGHNETLLIDNLVVTPGAAPPLPPIEGLLGYWRFEEGAGEEVADSSGNGNDGEIVNPDGVWETDPALGSVYHSNESSYIDFGTILPALTNDSDFTWSFWVNADETDNNDIVFGNRWGPDGNDFAPREFIKFTPRVFEWHFEGGGENVPGDNTLLPIGEWVHNLVVKEGTTLSYYRNGVEIASSTITGTPVNAQPFYIGGQANAAGDPAETFSGSFEEAALFDRALSADEATEVYRRGINGESLLGDRDDGEAGEITSVSRGADGSVSIELPPGGSYDIQYSVDLINWTDIATGISGSFEDSEAARTALPEGFYRAVLQ